MNGISRTTSRLLGKENRIAAILLMGLTLACGEGEPPKYPGESYVGTERGEVTVLTDDGPLTLPCQKILMFGEAHTLAEGDIDLGLEPCLIPGSTPNISSSTSRNSALMDEAVQVNSLDETAVDIPPGWEYFASFGMPPVSAEVVSMSMSENTALMDEALQLDVVDQTTINIPPSRKWPGGKIIYELNPLMIIDPFWLLAIIGNMDEIQDETAVEFVKRDPNNPLHNNYIYITTVELDGGLTFGGGNTFALKYKCSAPWGHGKGRQTVVLSKESCSRYSILHVLLHVVGLSHEHNRWDRDIAMSINKDGMEQWQGDDPTTPEIETSYANPHISDQFKKCPQGKCESVGEIDVASTMMWDKTRYQDSANTIIIKDVPGETYVEDYEAAMVERRRAIRKGYNTKMSQGDIEAINALYADVTYIPFYHYLAEIPPLKDHFMHPAKFEQFYAWVTQNEIAFEAQQLPDQNSSTVPVYSMAQTNNGCFDHVLVRKTGDGFDDGGGENVHGGLSYFGWKEEHIAFYADVNKTAQNPVAVYLYGNNTVCDWTVSTIRDDPKYINDGYVMWETNPDKTDPEERYAIYYVHKGTSPLIP